MSVISDAERAAITTLCQQVLAHYAVSVDCGDWDRFVTLFTPDAEWTRPGSPPMRGPAEFRAFQEDVWRRRARENPNGHRTRHVFTTVAIDVLGADRATGIAYALVYRDPEFDGGTAPSPMPPGPELIVEYREAFTRWQGAWRISRHQAHHTFRAPFYRNMAAEPAG